MRVEVLRPDPLLSSYLLAGTIQEEICLYLSTGQPFWAGSTNMSTRAQSFIMCHSTQIFKKPLSNLADCPHNGRHRGQPPFPEKNVFVKFHEVIHLNGRDESSALTGDLSDRPVTRKISDK